MKKQTLIFAIAAALTVGGCSSDDEPEVLCPFPKSALALSVNTRTVSKRTDFALAAPDNFAVSFFKHGETEATAVYDYARMPDIVSLPVGEYDVVASNGDNAAAAWNTPYFRGETSTSVSVGDITVAKPIVCTVANACVSIMLHESLASVIDSNWRVDIDCNGETLSFTAANASDLAFFAAAGNALTATLSGRINGNTVSATHVISSPQPAHNYHLTFRLTGINPTIE